MSLSERLLRGQDAAGSTPRTGSPRLYRCHYCGLSDPDPEVVFDHMNRRECQAPAPVSPWVRQAQNRRLPAKALS